MIITSDPLAVLEEMKKAQPRGIILASWEARAILAYVAQLQRVIAEVAKAEAAMTHEEAAAHLNNAIDLLDPEWPYNAKEDK